MYLSSPDPTECTWWPSLVLLEHRVADLEAVVGSEQVEVVLVGGGAKRGWGAARRWRRGRAWPGCRLPVAAGLTAAGAPLDGGGGSECGRGTARRWRWGRARLSAMGKKRHRRVATGKNGRERKKQNVFFV
jgi:hypothetical protein